MADATQSAAEIVNDKYDRSIEIADRASEEVARTAQVFRDNSDFTPEQISAQWATLEAPELPDVGDIPALPAIELQIPDNLPGPLTATLPQMQVAEFTGTAPALTIPVAPSLVIGSAPVVPTVRDVEIPDAPTVTLPDAPQFLTLQTHTFGGVDMHEEWLDPLGDVPKLDLVEPAPFAFSPGARYASELLGSLQARLNQIIHGGTGLAPAVEAQIWGRAADRGQTLALARDQELLRDAEALGFPLPQGVLIGQRFDARRQAFDQLANDSREIAVEQAKLEQSNTQQAIQAALQLETVLMDNVYKMEQLAFQVAKETADNAIAAHNARIEYFKALLDGYRSYASVYQTLIQAEMNKVEVFRALLQAEQAKADINKSLVDRYRSEIEASMAGVEIYKARVGAAQTLVELERTRIQAGAEQIKGFIATINAEQAKAEIYKVQLEGEKTRMEVYGEEVKAYGLRVGAQAEVARANVANYQALISAKNLEWTGWNSRLAAASAQVEAAARTSNVIVNGYNMGARAIEAQAANYMRRWEADIQQYQAGTNITFAAAKYNADAIQYKNTALMEASKIEYTTSSQRLASAWAMVATSASISGSATLTQTI